MLTDAQRLELTAQIVAAYVGHNQMLLDQLPAFARDVFNTYAQIEGAAIAAADAANRPPEGSAETE